MKKLGQILWHIVMVLLILGILLGCFFAYTQVLKAQDEEEIVQEFSSCSYQAVPTDMPEILAIEGNAGIIFPDSTREVYAYTTGLRDIFVMARFEIDADELDVFVGSTLCSQALSIASEGAYQKLEGNPSWWEPYKSTHLEECYGEAERSRQHILVDMTDTETYIVYVTTSTY